MSHFALDNLVADLAKSAGAEIITSRTVDSIPEEFDRVIGCDGPNSAVRKILNLKEPQCRLAIQGFISGEEDKSSSSPFAATRVSDMVETWPIKNGFIWRIPRGGETEYGAIGNSKEVKSIFDAYLQKNNLQLERLASALVPNGLIVPANGLITLCGDAVGLTKPWSGGGVIWGLLAANLLLKDFPDFIRYKNAVKIFFWPRLLCSKIITKIVYFLGFNFPWLLPEKIKIESDFLI